MLIKSIITKHNAHIARKKKAQGKGTVNCSCSKNAICPLQKQCMTKDIVYKATVTSSNPSKIMNYIGMTSTSSGTLMPGSKIVNSRKYIKICKKSVKPSILTVQVLSHLLR
jgi:hypothetical protein